MQISIKPEQMGWKISNFEMGKKKSKTDKLVIKAGDFCRLFHREQEGFMCLRYQDTDLRVNSDKEHLATDKLYDEFLPSKEQKEQFYIHLKLSSVIRRSKVANSSTTIFKIEN